MISVAFLFKGGRRARVNSAADFPTEFYYGYVQLSQSRDNISLYEDSDFGYSTQASFLWRAFSMFFLWLTGIHPYVVWKLLSTSSRNKLNRHDAIVTTTASSGFALATLKFFGVLQCDVYFIVMGALRTHHHFVRRLIQKCLLQKIKPLVISKGELSYLKEHLHYSSKLEYLPFGVDHNFWTPKIPQKTHKPFVLSIGNDLNRDYASLIAAWRPEFPELKIITQLELPPCPQNISVFSGDWRNQTLSDVEIRELYRQSLFVILPIKETIQPSGQSACLQAMACGKAVILSDIQGLWDRELMKSHYSCVLVPPGSPNGLRKETVALLNNPEQTHLLGINARNVIETHLNTENTSNCLGDIIFNL